MSLEILVIDGQGGRMGRMLVEALRSGLPAAHITAVGTNSTATESMRKGGADQCATGENPVVVCSRRAHIITGPVGILMADALLGEVTPRIAAAVGQSDAEKVLVPVNRCRCRIAGVQELSLSELIQDAVHQIGQFAKENKLC